jgi:hypothetical protein
VLRPTGCWTKVFLHEQNCTKFQAVKTMKKDLQCCIMR